MQAGKPLRRQPAAGSGSGKLSAARESASASSAKIRRAVGAAMVRSLHLRARAPLASAPQHSALGPSRPGRQGAAASLGAGPSAAPAARHAGGALPDSAGARGPLSTSALRRCASGRSRSASAASCAGRPGDRAGAGRHGGVRGARLAETKLAERSTVGAKAGGYKICGGAHDVHLAQQDRQHDSRHERLRQEPALRQTRAVRNQKRSPKAEGVIPDRHTQARPGHDLWRMRRVLGSQTALPMTDSPAHTVLVSICAPRRRDDQGRAACVAARAAGRACRNSVDMPRKRPRPYSSANMMHCQ